MEFSSPGLREKHGELPYSVESVDRHSGGVRLTELPGVTFDPDDFRVVQPVARRAKPEPMKDAGAIENVRRFISALPDPLVDLSESGFRETSFYRFPLAGNCFCGKVKRYTLDGETCEDRHY